MHCGAVLYQVPNLYFYDDGDDGDAGWITDRRPRWCTPDSVPHRSSCDVEEDPGPGGW